ncbi:hypothetical protein L6452_10022 [Arctium lappa]|uniref:Uncharacterized protein n=1 Tax=Arctium lappa TaxID=4217 RepID=A0ACB9DMH1_ARCLA|nr:hypothetical protein L6452_10022 [Arctium lappa]
MDDLKVEAVLLLNQIQLGFNSLSFSCGKPWPLSESKFELFLIIWPPEIFRLSPGLRDYAVLILPWMSEASIRIINHVSEVLKKGDNRLLNGGLPYEQQHYYYTE